MGMNETFRTEPVQVHGIICLCGLVNTFPTTWEYVRCPGCGLDFYKRADGSYEAKLQEDAMQ